MKTINSFQYNSNTLTANSTSGTVNFLLPNLFEKVDPSDLYLLQDMFYILHKDIFLAKLLNRSSYFDGPSCGP